MPSRWHQIACKRCSHRSNHLRWCSVVMMRRPPLWPLLTGRWPGRRPAVSRAAARGSGVIRPRQRCRAVLPWQGRIWVRLRGRNRVAEISSSSGLRQLNDITKLPPSRDCNPGTFAHPEIPDFLFILGSRSCKKRFKWDCLMQRFAIFSLLWRKTIGCYIKSMFFAPENAYILYFIQILCAM